MNLLINHHHQALNHPARQVAADLVESVISPSPQIDNYHVQSQTIAPPSDCLWSISSSSQYVEAPQNISTQPSNRLLTVQFDQRRNRLEILAAQALVPQLYLAEQSHQLWIDLINVTVDRTSLQREAGPAVNLIQVMPIDQSSTRIWLEMAVTNALKPHLIELVPQAPNYWLVQLANWRSMCDRHYSGRHPPRFRYVTPLVGEIRVSYGWRIHPIFKDWQFHRGIDIAAPLKTPIGAAAAGNVIFSGWNNSGYGNLLVIEHSNCSKTLYAHNHKLLVRQGAQVEAGQTIALTGSTGRSIESHLHFEILPDGKHSANPVDYLPPMTREELYLALNAVNLSPQVMNAGNNVDAMIESYSVNSRSQDESELFNNHATYGLRSL